MNIKPDILFLVFLILAWMGVIVLAVWSFITEKRLKRFFLGKKAKDLEETILALQNEVKRLDARKVKIETIRFNPFPDQGSNQSFAIGILNEDNDGVVISSLYSRERMSIFAKPVRGGKSGFELSEEEENVIEKAARTK